MQHSLLPHVTSVMEEAFQVGKNMTHFYHFKSDVLSRVCVRKRVYLFSVSPCASHTVDFHKVAKVVTRMISHCAIQLMMIKKQLCRMFDHSWLSHKKQKPSQSTNPLDLRLECELS